MSCSRTSTWRYSHSHFDHLDLTIIPYLPSSVQWIVPTGLTPLLASNGVAVDHIHELGWWDSVQLDLAVSVQGAAEPVPRTLQLAAVPASHWSARTPLDTARSLWNSYAVTCTAAAARPAKLFFCGDSGYSPSLFKAIGRVHGPFDLATIPIGSYEPRWHLGLQHMDPHGSVHVALDIGARHSFGMHWGTWTLSGTSLYLPR